MNLILDLPFVDTSQRNWPQVYSQRMSAYHAYLISNKHLLPPGALEYTFADWHYDFVDHRSPHDARLLEVSGNCFSETNGPLRLVFLSSYEDWKLVLEYDEVHGISFADPTTELAARQVDDVLIDQVTLGGVNLVEHSIVFRSKTIWQIICKDFRCELLAVSTAT